MGEQVAAGLKKKRSRNAFNIKTDAFECAVDEYAACGEESINPNSREVLLRYRVFTRD